MAETCILCGEDIVWVAYGSCCHGVACSTCVARLRFISLDFRCLECQEEREFVIVRKALVDSTCKPEFPTFLTELEADQELNEGPIETFWYNASTKAFFDDFDEYTRINEMCELGYFKCTSCGEPDFECIGKLMIHLHQKHRLYMCTICLRERQLFICEQTHFTKAELNKHIKTGHPHCNLCRHPFYGEKVFIHEKSDTCSCDMCELFLPWNNTISDPEGHFFLTHIAANIGAKESYWLAKFGVLRAFQTEDDLRRHYEMEHVYSLAKRQRLAPASTKSPLDQPDSPPNRREGKALREKLWERFFEGLKDKSGKFRHGLIDGRSYLKYLEGLGLADLVCEVARFCPDNVRKKELIDASLRRDDHEERS